MGLRTTLRSLWRNIAGGRAADRELDHELQSYVDLLSDEYREDGANDPAAERQARLALGGAENVKERVRDARRGHTLLTLGSDVHYAMRLLRRSPSFAIAAIVSIALGTAATSAVFGLLNAAQLRHLPVAHAGELAAVRLDGPRCCRHTGRNRQVSVPLWREIAQHQDAFSGLLAFADTRFNLAPSGEVRYVEGLYVSGNFFSVLGVAPVLGRAVTPEDDQPGCANAGAVISHALWQGQFSGRADVLSQSLTLGRLRYSIIGVMPAHFLGVEVGRRFEVALPLCASGFGRADHWWLAVMGRLKPGWTASRAGTHLAALGPQLLRAALPPNYGAEQAQQFVNLRFTVVAAANGVSPLREQYQQPLWVLLAIAALVLIAALVNVANLSLVRGVAREPEFALRFALGASRSRVLRQLLLEGLVLALAGTALGLLAARVVHVSVLSLLSTSTDRIVLDVGPDWRVFAMTAIGVCLATLALAITPGLRRVSPSLTRGSTRGTPGRRGTLAREVCVAVQVALAVVLVAGAVMFVFTARNLVATDRGFETAHLFYAHVFTSDAAYPVETRAAAQRDLLERLRQVPGVVAAGHATTPPLGGSTWGTMVRVNTSSGEITDEVVRNQVSAGYLETMRMALLNGRDFSDHDTPGSPKVAIVNTSFVRRFFADGSPLGRQLADGGQAFTIVGVVGDSAQYFLREARRPIFYSAASQDPAPSTTIRFALRAAADIGPAIDGVRRTLAEVSPSSGVRFATLDDAAASSMQTEQLMATLSAAFGAIAIVLSTVGVFGLISYTATSRRREIGIRLALGARAVHVMTTVIGRIAIVSGIGVLAGVLLTLPASGLAASLLYGVTIASPSVLATIVGVIAAAGVIAALFPVRRAIRTDPVVALRAE